MSPSAIILNVCAATFLALFIIFTSYLIARFIRMRQQQTIEESGKQIAFYKASAEVPAQAKTSKLRLAEAK
ncbi:hypothetical protein [Cesiribacter andamanensis]|uniref:Uncharacterized protein n=1 Tax=Cesiribacter andamanensis AMV16 TaxID=1279009 RepID=M7N0K9_9BACT|nr:hypothetical protein [Cesiribacter andamanensis]EMR00746.1 hypothetical protein ADICEAN_04132 [Cesiribacter andamanensis AMV16]